MGILDNTDASFMVDEDILNFTLDGGDEEESPKSAIMCPKGPYSSSLESSNLSNVSHEYPEEELEWLSNKDAFPGVETCFGILADNPELLMNHQSPISVLENSNSNSSSSSSNNNGGEMKFNGITIASCCDSLKVQKKHPVRARSQRRTRKRAVLGNLPNWQSLWSNQVNIINKKEPALLPPLPVAAATGATIGRRCLHCQADKTPQWRAGPMGPKTLCNACGVRYKSGRLLPEYRPASSPTFSSVLHSNSHRKVVEMRKQKQLPVGGGGGSVVNETCAYMVG